MAPGMPFVDVHHHMLPRPLLEKLRKEAGGARRLVNERISITLTDELADPDAHLDAMRQAGVDVAVMAYSGVSLLGPDVCREVNDGFAAVQKHSQNRLFGSVHVHLADPDAPRELERGIKDLGLRAVALPTTELGMALDHPSLGPLWDKIQALGAPVILHPTLLPQGASTDFSLERSCFRPFDTTLAAVRLAYGVLPSRPGITVILPHVGGTTVFLRGRLAIFFEPADADVPEDRRGFAKTVSEQRALGLDKKFEEAWSHFYYDTAGSGGWPHAVEMAARVVGTERIMFGTDYPLETYSGATVRELVEMVQGLPLSEDQRKAIAGANAARLFHLAGGA